MASPPPPEWVFIVTVIPLAVGPIAYAATGLHGLLAGVLGGMVGGLSIWFTHRLSHRLAIGLFGGISMGLSVVPIVWLPSGLVALLPEGLLIGFMVGFMGGFLRLLKFPTGNSEVSRLLLAAFGLFAATLVGLSRALDYTFQYGSHYGLLTGILIWLGYGLFSGLLTGILGWLGYGIGLILSPKLYEGFMDFPDLWPYVRLMVRPLFGYALGYAALVLWFASTYTALYRRFGELAFSKSSPHQFADFLFFAITIFPPIGAYSDVQPSGSGTQAIVAGELIIGVAYTTVVFAAIIAYLTPKFDTLGTMPTHTEEVIRQAKTDLEMLPEALSSMTTQMKFLNENMIKLEQHLSEIIGREPTPHTAKRTEQSTISHDSD